MLGTLSQGCWRDCVRVMGTVICGFWEHSAGDTQPDVLGYSARVLGHSAGCTGDTQLGVLGIVLGVLGHLATVLAKFLRGALSQVLGYSARL